MIERRQIVLLFIVPLLVWFLLNELNLKYAISVDKTHYNYVNLNADTEFYTMQIENYMAGHGFTYDANNAKEMAVRRTPGYPLFYALHYVVFGKEGSYWAIRYTQLLLFSLSCVLLTLAVFNFTQNKRWAILAGWTYALSPFIAIYAYYTITESMTPFWVVLTLFCASLYYKDNQKKYLYLTGLVAGALFLTRPIMGIMFPAIFLAIINYTELRDFGYLRKKMIEGFVYTFGFASLVLPWVVRNYMITGGEIIVAEKFYNEAPMNFGRDQLYFRTLRSAWANTGDGQTEFFAPKLRAYAATGNDSAATQEINNFIKSQPPQIFEIIERQRYNQLIQDLYSCFKETYQYKQEHPDHLRDKWLNMPCQFENKEKAIALLDEYKAEAPFSYYIITPIKNIIQFTFQSNTHHIISLNPQGRNFTIVQKLIKAACLLLNLVLILSLVVFLFTKSNAVLKISFGLSFGVSLIVIVWGLRHLENRYIIPFYPCAYIAFSYFLMLVWNWFEKKKATYSNN